MSFHELRLAEPIVRAIATEGYTTPTPIQTKAIPEVLAGRDVLGCAQTGTGKTAAFLIAAFQRVLTLGTDTTRNGQKQPRIFILSPTRELAVQIGKDAEALGKYTGLEIALAFGGTDYEKQRNRIQSGIDVLVGTPGRIIDYFKQGVFKLDQIEVVILDEVDRMLDMGFRDELEAILETLPSERRTHMVSATFPAAILRLAKNYQSDPVRVNGGRPGEAHEDIEHIAYLVNDHERYAALVNLLLVTASERTLVFVNTRAETTQLAERLAEDGFSSMPLSGELPQAQRTRTLSSFRSGTVSVLIATDVAARGIDVADLDLVINYDLPSQPDVYIHRIGRTGRAGKAGLAVALATGRDGRKVAAIEERLGAPLGRVTPDAGDNRTPAQLARLVARPAEMDTILIGGGRKDKVRPGDILGALTGEAGGLKGTDIGKIEILDRRSYVAVATSVSRDAVKSLQNGRIKGRRFFVELVARLGS